jgi:hypothetical protein
MQHRKHSGVEQYGNPGWGVPAHHRVEHPTEKQLFNDRADKSDTEQ